MIIDSMGRFPKDICFCTLSGRYSSKAYPQGKGGAQWRKFFVNVSEVVFAGYMPGASKGTCGLSVIGSEGNPV